jgi:monoamine oxidase
MHWPTHPHTLGSYACYRPGQWAFYGIEGAREGNVHFCGEHCSLEFQGYMEGAAETGALVAAAILDDLGLEPSPMHRRIVERKLVLPHPAVDGRLPSRPRWRARQRSFAAR